MKLCCVEMLIGRTEGALNNFIIISSINKIFFFFQIKHFLIVHKLILFSFIYNFFFFFVC